jgi:predicted nuclease of predicted toxin-antitoxin system
MKFLMDQDVYGATTRHLKNSVHDVLTAHEAGLSRANDEELLKEAQQQGRILITRDRDFGSLVFIEALGSGVIYLRILPSTAGAVHAELDRVIQSYSEKALCQAFVVVEPGRYRFRRLPDRRASDE